MMLFYANAAAGLIQQHTNDDNCSFAHYSYGGLALLVQILIVESPINNFFKTTQQSWKEWLFAIAVGAGSLVVSFLTRLLSR